MLAWSAIGLLRLVLRCTREASPEVHNKKARRRQADASWGDKDFVSDNVRHLGVSKLPHHCEVATCKCMGRDKGGRHRPRSLVKAFAFLSKQTDVSRRDALQDSKERL